MPSKPLSAGAGLLNDTAGNTGTATAERLRLVGVVVAGGMDHQRVALEQVEISDPGCCQLPLGRAIRGDGEYRQVAQMASALRPLVLLRLFRIPVPTGGSPRHDLALVVRPRPTIGV